METSKRMGSGSYKAVAFSIGNETKDSWKRKNNEKTQNRKIYAFKLVYIPACQAPGITSWLLTRRPRRYISQLSRPHTRQLTHSTATHFTVIKFSRTQKTLWMPRAKVRCQIMQSKKNVRGRQTVPKKFIFTHTRTGENHFRVHLLSSHTHSQQPASHIASA